MKMTLNNKIRIFIIAVVTLLVVGIAMLSFLGFNQDVDNKSSYEMQVSIDQVAGDSVEVLKDSSNKAIAEIGKYTLQELDKGAMLVYKFDFDVTEYASSVETAVNTALSQSTTFSGVEAQVKVYKSAGNVYTQTSKLILALGVSLAIIFVYSLIMNKLSSAVAGICSSVLSVLLFTALMAITRIPAYPFFEVLCALAMVLSSAIALALTSRYKAVSKTEDKATAFTIAEKVNNSFRCVFIALAGCILLTSIIVGVVGLATSIFLALAILLAGLSAVASAVYMTPLMWSVLKGIKK